MFKTITIGLRKVVKIKEARKVLKANHIEWTEHNQGIHFILHITDDTEDDIHFWPKTGKFWCKSINYKGRKINNLIRTINKRFPFVEE